MLDFLTLLGMERIGWWSIGLCLIAGSFAYWRMGYPRHHIVTAGVTGFIMIWGGAFYRATYEYPMSYAAIGASVLIFWLLAIYYGLGLRDQQTSRKTPSATTTLVKDNENLTRAFQQLPIGCILLGRDGVVIEVNEALCSDFGYRPSEIIGRHINMLLPARHHEGHQDKVRAVIDGRVPATGWRNVTGQHRDGSEVNIKLSVKQVRSGILDDGAAIGIGMTEVRR